MAKGRGLLQGKAHVAIYHTRKRTAQVTTHVTANIATSPLPVYKTRGPVYLFPKICIHWNLSPVSWKHPYKIVKRFRCRCWRKQNTRADGNNGGGTFWREKDGVMSGKIFKTKARRNPLSHALRWGRLFDVAIAWVYYTLPFFDHVLAWLLLPYTILVFMIEVFPV